MRIEGKIFIVTEVAHIEICAKQGALNVCQLTTPLHIL